MIEDSTKQFWPIVKKVTIRLSGCDVVSSGAILMDLPGLGGSSTARDNIVKDVSIMTVQCKNISFLLFFVLKEQNIVVLCELNFCNARYRTQE